MAEMGQTSSMTSVTEEESSADSESDTTESSYSNVTSSVLSSTDTDDKLTPGFTSISISNTASSPSSPSKKRKQRTDDVSPCPVDTGFSEAAKTESQKSEINTNLTPTNDNSCHPVKSTTAAIVHPYGSNPLPLDTAEQENKRRKKEVHLPMPSPQGSTVHPTALSQMMMKRGHPTFCKENLGIDDTDNRLSTDFSDTSSIRGDKGNENCSNSNVQADSNEDIKTTDSEERLPQQRPFFPDMEADSWYQARCFDRYWTHYNFVMEWYQAHVYAVKTLQGQMTAGWGVPGTGGRHTQPQEQSRRVKRKKRSRSSRRRDVKARTKGKPDDSATVLLSATEVNVTSPDARMVSPSTKKTESDEDEEEEEIEMEITEEMMEFFTTSFKHRLERDGAKEGEEKNRQNIEEAKAGQQGPSSSAPMERPGVRRTAEMRELYGAGAPMIHGMETALQMTFDRISDRFQPKLWPNMPLKIIFA